MILPCEWWGEQVDYSEAYIRQIEARRKVGVGERENFFAALTHSPTITVGRRHAETPSSDELKGRGIALVKANRGGLATYHGPGQLMVYMFIDVVGMKIRIREIVSAIEKGLINWLAEVGIAARCMPGSPGVFVKSNSGELEKIAAIGMNFSRGVSMHGFALYLSEEPDTFSLIDPCGVKGGKITSVETQLSKSISAQDCFDSVVNKIRASILLECKKG